MPEPTPGLLPPPSTPLDDTQEITVDAYLPVEGLPVRKDWWKSWKVRCCWIASLFPTSAGALQLLSQWQAGQELHVDTATVWQAMLPWMALVFGDGSADLIKVWHEWKSGIRG